MKKKKFKGKLSLKKEVVGKLQDNEMHKVLGGKEAADSGRLCRESYYGPCTLIPLSEAAPCCTAGNCSNFCC